MKKFRRVVLHFGADKTGSTAIQASLNASREKLLDAGVVAYPPGQWHARLGSVFCDSPEKYVFNIQNGFESLDQLRRSDRRYLDNIGQWIGSVPQCEALVFSYEGFVDLDEVALSRFKVFCESFADTVTAVLYVRPPLSYAVSAMSQRVKQGVLSWPLNAAPIAPYRKFLEKMEAAFGKTNLCVRQYSPHTLLNQDVVADFLDFLGVPAQVLDGSMGTSRRNEGLSWPALCIGETIVNALVKRGITILQGEFYNEIGQHLTAIQGDRIRLTSDQIEELMQASHPHTEYLRSRHEIIFSEDIGKYLRQPGDSEFSLDHLVKSPQMSRQDKAHHEGERRSDFSVPEFELQHCELKGMRAVERGQLLCFELDFCLGVPVGELEVGIHVFDARGREAFSTTTGMLGRPLRQVSCGSHKIRYMLVADLPSGEYAAGFTFAECHESGQRDLGRYGRVETFAVTEPSGAASRGYANLPAEFDYRQTAAVVSLIQDAAGTLTCDAMLGDVSVGESFVLPVRLRNASSQTWVNSRFNPINLSYHWRDEAGNSVVFEGGRTPLPVKELLPGQTVAAQMRILAPGVAGRYSLVLVPVQEQRCWLDERGFSPGVREFDVIAARAPRRYPGADVRLFTQAGRREGGALVHAGKRGFLMFGPHAQLPMGRYVARLEGHCEAGAADVWVDVSCEKGRRVLARQDIYGEAASDTIAELAFEVDVPVNDLQVRLWGGVDTRMRVDALCIGAAGADAEACSDEH